MAIVPERNDINISKLFNWGKYFEIFDNKNILITGYYHRLPTDEEVNKARVYALRKSAELRKKLRDTTSDERVAFIGEKEFLSKEQITEAVIFYKTQQIVTQAYSDIDFPFPKEPKSDSTLEEQENYQLEVDTYIERRDKFIKDKVNKAVDLEKEGLISKPLDELYTLYEELVIDSACQKEMISRYRDYCIFSGSFSDEKYKEKLFTSLEEVNELPETIKKQFLTNYLSLDIDMEELKK